MLLKDVFLLFYTRRLANIKLMDFLEDKPTEPECKEGQPSAVTRYILDRAKEKRDSRVNSWCYKVESVVAHQIKYLPRRVALVCLCTAVYYLLK